MKSPVVRLKIRVRLPDGSRPFPDLVIAANGKLKPSHAVVDGIAEHHPEGTYFLRFADANGKRVYKPIGEGDDPLTELRRKQKALDARATQPERVRGEFDGPRN